MLKAKPKTAPPPAAALSARALTIRRMDVFPVALPLAKPMKMARVLIRNAENLFVRIETSGGDVGWGEAASAPGMTGETHWGMAAMAELLGEHVVGADARMRPRLLARLDKAVYGNTSVKSAIEMALIDVTGRALGINASDLLGGRFHDRVVPMWLIGNATVEEDVADVRRQLQAGFRFFKLKVGSKPLEADIEAAHAVRAALGPDIMLCADANCGLGMANAARFLRETVAAKLCFLEQPIAPGNLAGMAQLQALGCAPIGADESIHALADIEQHAADNAISGLSLKLIKLGGPTALLRAAHRAGALGLSINVAAKVSETSLGSAAAAHCAACIANADWGISLTHVYLAHDPVKHALAMHDGAVLPPDGPGWGVEVDEAAIREFAAKRE